MIQEAMLWLEKRDQKWHAVLWPEGRLRLCCRRQVVFPLQDRDAAEHHWLMELFS